MKSRVPTKLGYPASNDAQKKTDRLPRPCNKTFPQNFLLNQYARGNHSKRKAASEHAAKGARHLQVDQNLEGYYRGLFVQSLDVRWHLPGARSDDVGKNTSRRRC